ncbi:TetR/AcrR family transcriptional regulator [Streptomyces halobius]|uniref:TetR/AcrR family transcriptional regulator helix-turn-helix transcriptional regulator n=1 Tax=Streptomyces halobius TaxID=2879846 RepID=A0ABY4MK34_9ACTN|nr:TetR/AcrR family transcriptional regulator [Streptomyces halobius]UQA98149.1 TetR/AcrR family transcriptional regulator; helix-turn-helix transcriptional regulator [Streptomyces halobius]
MRTVDPARHRARRRHIVNAAAELFAAKGFERTTTAEICKAAGMSAGNLFHYFPNKRAIFHAVFEDDEHGEADRHDQHGEQVRYDGHDRHGECENAPTKYERLAAARAADDPLTALLDTVDLLTAPAREPLAPALVMEAMIQAYRDPELEALLSRDNDEERSTLTTVLRNAAAAGQIDPDLDPDDTAAWVMALIAALYINAATDPSFSPADQLPTLRLIIQRFLRPDAVPERATTAGTVTAGATTGGPFPGR